MNLYHYSKKRYTSLLTRRRTGSGLPKGVKVPEDYLDHISLFFDPIPSKLLPDIFDKGHPFWFKGNSIYEYIVDVSTLPVDIGFHVVETPRESALFADFIKRNRWDGNDPRMLRRWEELLDAKQKEWGEKGVGQIGLVKAVNQFLDTTAEGYSRAKKSPDFDDGYNKYAAGVPHLMLYPKSGEITIAGVKRLVIGSDLRHSVDKVYE